MAASADPSRRFATAVSLLVEQMDADLGPLWDSLTGLQIVLLKIIARGERVTRTDLMTEARTSRAAMVPGLASLIQKGFIVEPGDFGDTYLAVAPAGQELLAHVENARAVWVSRAAQHAMPAVRGEDLNRAARLLEHLAGNTDHAQRTG